ELHFLHREQLLILLRQRVARACEDGDQIFFGQIVERRDDRQATDELRDQAVFDEIFRFDLLEHLADWLLLFGLDRRAEADAALADAPSDQMIEADERAAADEEDVRGVDLHILLLRIFLRSARSDAALRALEDLQEALLHAFAGDVARR